MEPVEYQRDRREPCERVHFVGVSAAGYPVIQTTNWGTIFAADSEYLRMAPKKVTWYCLIVNDGNGIPVLLRHRVAPIWATDLKWIGVPFTVEVEE